MDYNKLTARWANNKDLNTQLSIANSLLDNFLGTKTASELDEEAKKVLSEYVAFTRALYLLHQQNHWDAQAYGDHLLFQRLYEDNLSMADDAAERVAGLCGEIIFTGQDAIVKKFEPKIKTISSLLESSLDIEKAYQDVVKHVYDYLKEHDSITLGLDDMLMSQASQGEVHIYLLQQALKGMNEEDVGDQAKEIIEKSEALHDIFVVQAAKKKKSDYKPKDIIEYIESALKVRPYEEVSEYFRSLESDLLDQVISILLKTNPVLLKKIFFSSITKKDPSIEVNEVDPIDDIQKVVVI